MRTFLSSFNSRSHLRFQEPVNPRRTQSSLTKGELPATRVFC
jgi:hypothetical protein